MTDTRMVRLEQIAAGPVVDSGLLVTKTLERRIDRSHDGTVTIKARQIADAAGGDVFEPINGLEAGLAEALRRAKWPHLVQVEVVNG